MRKHYNDQQGKMRNERRESSHDHLAKLSAEKGNGTRRSSSSSSTSNDDSTKESRPKEEYARSKSNSSNEPAGHSNSPNRIYLGEEAPMPKKSPDRAKVADAVLRKSTMGEKTARERKKEELVALVLELFDERKDLYENEQNLQEDAKQVSERIEEEIRERNRTFEILKTSGRPLPIDKMKEVQDRRVKKQMLYTVPVEQLNLKVMNPEQDNTSVDIVAVHGLGAIPDITWVEKTSGINWLSHRTMLPSAAPQARILRFGYDSLWMGKTPIRTSLSTIAYKLLLSLSMKRVDDLQRPLIFIGHCFGGLVIQRALNLAKMQQDAYPGIFDSSIGVVFLGTPHRGTQSFAQDSALFAAIAASSDLSRNLEPEVLSSLTSDNGALLDVTDDFVRLCVDRGPMITCFFEQRPSRLGKIVGRNDINEFIVDQRSATLDGYHRYGLESDHFTLNKFDSPDNPNYIQVRAEILRFYHLAVEKVKRLSNFVPIRPTSSHFNSTVMSSIENAQPSQTLARLSRRPGTSDLRNRSPHMTGSKAMNRRMSWQPQSQLASDDEGDIRKEAIKELQAEEAKKQKVLHEKETNKRLQEEKYAAEQLYLERLKRNMAKYGIENPGDLLTAYPFPQDGDLSPQEINDKEKWYKNLMKGKLFSMGLNGGQIDEILNDTGELMLIDGVETTFTKMAKRWISTRTLDKYEIPWQYDEEDESAIIIKRWVPDYERDFLWDHSQAVRDSRDRKHSRDHLRTTKTPTQEGSEWTITQGKSSIRRMNSFKDRQKRDPQSPIEPEKYAKGYAEGSKRSGKYDGHISTERIRQPEIRRRGTNREPRRKASLQTLSEVFEWTFDRDRSHYDPRKAKLNGSRTNTPPQDHRLRATHDTTRSAPDIQEVDRRRQNSRVLDKWRVTSSEQLH